MVAITRKAIGKGRSRKSSQVANQQVKNSQQKSRQQQTRKEDNAAEVEVEVEVEAEEEEDIIRLDSEPTSSSPIPPPPLPPQQRKLVQTASRMASMRLETGLPTPSYFRFEKVGNVRKATLDPSAKPVRAQIQAVLSGKTASKSTQKEQAGVAGGKTTTSVHERNREREQDAKMLMMRNYIDPKRFYKNLDGLAPGFQVGTVIEGRTDVAHGRLTRRERKRTFVDEILADRAVRTYSKRKFQSIQKDAQSGRKGWYKARQRKFKPKWARG